MKVWVMGQGRGPTILACSLPWDSLYCTYLKVGCYFLLFQSFFLSLGMGGMLLGGHAYLGCDSWIPSRAALQNDNFERQERSCIFSELLFE